MSTRNLKSPTLLAQDIHSVYGGTREFATSVRSRQGLLSTLRSAVRSPHASITSFRSGDVVLSNNHLLATSASAGDELIEKLRSTLATRRRSGSSTGHPSRLPKDSLADIGEPPGDS